MKNEIKKISDCLLKKIGYAKLENDLNVNQINCFYYENMTDSQFFDCCGAKNNFIDFYSNIAKNGVKTIIFGGLYVGLKQSNKSYMPHINENNNTLKIIEKTIKNIHRYGSKAIIKIIPAYGREININKTLNIFKRTASFEYDINDSRLLTFPISDNMISSIKDEIIKLSVTAQNINADGIMIDACNSNILGELVSFEFNKRRFGYYTKESNILFEIIKQIKKKCKFIKIYVKINLFSLIFSTFYKNNKIKSLQKLKNNLKNNQSFELINQLIIAGCDGFEFEFGAYENDYLKSLNQFITPTIFNDLYENINTYISTKHSDKNVIIFNSYSCNINGEYYINISKQYLSDNKFIKNLKNNEPYRRCIKCMYCTHLANKNNIISCAINPSLFNDELVSTNKKTVAIIGSGVSGLVCAITLASRGFIVDLYEKHNILNKTGLICEIFDFDSHLKNYNNYLIYQINYFSEKSRINIILNKEVFSDSFNKNKYYAIILATGFKQLNFCANGAIQNHVKSLYDILGNKTLLKNKKHIVIYAKSELSFKLALYLLKNNFSVSIMVNQKIINSFIHPNLTYYLYVFYNLNLKIYLDSKIKVINEDNIEIIVNKNYEHDYVSTIYNILSNENYKYSPQLKTIDCDLFIFEPDIKPNNKLYYDFVKSNYKGQLFLIGQALEQGNLANDIESGYFVGKNL